MRGLRKRREEMGSVEEKVVGKFESEEVWGGKCKGCGKRQGGVEIHKGGKDKERVKTTSKWNKDSR